MKHSFIALSILTAIFTVTFVACTKKDMLLNDQRITKPGSSILPAKSDTPYVIPAAKDDTPYGRINTPVRFPLIEEPGIKIPPAAKGDTPYGKIRIPVIKPE